jgi:hypothetical protein
MARSAGLKPKSLAFEHNGVWYFSVKHFAWVTHRSETNVRKLMYRGNRIRRLTVEYVNGRPAIPYDELLHFPFTLPGRNSTEVYNYDEDGQQVEAPTV